jgi:hypothetical protein
MIPLARKTRTIHPTAAIKCNITYYFAIYILVGVINYNFK